MLVDGAVRTELPNATTADYSESMQRFVPFGAPRHVGPVSGDGRAALARLPGHLWGSGRFQFFWACWRAMMDG
jgi:hypothetical protein